MYNILQIGNLVFQTPQGSVTVKSDDRVNEYQTEAGKKRIELIRADVLSGNITFGGLLVADIATYRAALSTVTSITLFNPLINNTETISAKISNIQANKIEHNANFSAWSLSFDFKEL